MSRLASSGVSAWRWVGVGVVALVAMLSLVGLIAYVAVHQAPGPRTRLGVKLDDLHVPTLVSAQCPGQGLRSARLVLADTGALIWSADLRAGPAVTALPMKGEVSGYDVSGSVGQVSDVVTLKLDSATGTSERSLSDNDLTFSLASLKQDQVLVGVAGNGSLDFESVSDFNGPVSGC